MRPQKHSECSTCNGYGGDYVRESVDNWEWLPCDQCRGTGWYAGGVVTHALHDLKPVRGPYTHTYTPQIAKPMTRHQTYRYCRYNGWKRRDSVLMALLSVEERPLDQQQQGASFTVEET